MTDKPEELEASITWDPQSGQFNVDCGTHNYEVMDPDEGGYFKRSERGSGEDRQVGYAMLFCTKCGATLEVVAMDKRGPGDAED